MRIAKPILVIAVAAGVVAANAYAQDSASVSKSPGVPQTLVGEKSRPASPDFGLVQEHYVRVGGSEFVTDGAAAQYYSNTWNPEVSGYNWRGYFFSTSGYHHVYGWVHAPGGAQLTYAELDYCNTDATNDLVMNVYGCGYRGDCGGTPLATLTGAANTGCSNASFNGTLASAVNNFFDEYLLDVVFPTNPSNSTVNLAGAIIGWKYQISPAPATQTFNDVAPGDFGFQHIEALAASGITGGCGGGNFCPNNSLTRAQMAVFLAKALGLFWGGY